MTDIRFIVQRYLGEGRVVLPVKAGEKATRYPKWSDPDVRPVVTDFAEGDNIAERLDEVVDIDCDCAATRAIAPKILPPTGRIHGRPSLGPSHYWYKVAEPIKPQQFKDTDGSVLLEIRTGHQQYTLVPPSIVMTKGDAPEPETLLYEVERGEANVEGKGLIRLVMLTATAALLGLHWPKGSRHVAARDAAGFLAARDIDGKEIEEVIRWAATFAGDDEIEDRVRAARDTAKTFAAGGKTTGGPTLEASVGKEVVALLMKWYGGNTAVHDGVVDELNRKHFATMIGKDFVVGTETGSEVRFHPEKSLFAWYANEKVAIGEKTRGASKGEKITKTKYEIWRESQKRRQFAGVTFAPNPRACPEGFYNLWKGLAVEPGDGDCTKFVAHIHDNLCSGNEEHFSYLMKLMAFTVQQPGTPSEVAVVLRGPLGAGKGIYARNFGALFGIHYVQLDRAEHLTGKFNASISGKVVVFADEAFFAGDKTHLGTLKRIITEPTLQIERKGIDATREPNNMHLFMATNEDWSIPAGFQERRFFVLNVSDAHMQDHAYFNAIQKDLDEGGLRGFLKLLLDMPVTHNDIRQVPRTDELRVQQEFTMAAELKWWKRVLHHGIFGQYDEWPEWVNVNDLHIDYIAWCDQMRINRRVSDIDLARRVLTAWLGETRRDRTDRGRIRLRKIMPLAECRQLFDRQAGTVTPWDEEPTPGVLEPKLPEVTSPPQDEIPF